MFHSAVENQIADQGDCALVVAEERHSLLRETEFTNEAPQPDGLLGCFHQGNHFRFGCGERDASLPFACSRNWGSPEQKNESGRGFASLQVAGVVRVTVAEQLVTFFMSLA